MITREGGGDEEVVSGMGRKKRDPRKLYNNQPLGTERDRQSDRERSPPFSLGREEDKMRQRYISLSLFLSLSLSHYIYIYI